MVEHRLQRLAVPVDVAQDQIRHGIRSGNSESLSLLSPIRQDTIFPVWRPPHSSDLTYTLSVCRLLVTSLTRTKSMSKRVNIMLPDQTIRVLDRVAPKGDRSRFISQAVLHYVQTQSRANLRERLKQGALAHAKLDLEIAQEWFPVEQELWDRLEIDDPPKKPSRSAGKSTSRRLTRR